VNASEWLASRRPAPPAKLAQRLESALSEFLSAPDVTPSDAFAVAAAGLLRRLMKAESKPSSRREEAIDLLAADALVTYAIEAAADECESFAERTDAVIARLAVLVD
jgi:hypothetical protein